MHDAKKINAIVDKIASRGGSSNTTPATGAFSARMAAGKAAKKTERAASQPTPGVSSTAAPSPVVTGKGARPTHVKQPKTSVPEVKQGKKGPTMQTGAGKGHTVNVHIHNK